MRKKSNSALLSIIISSLAVVIASFNLFICISNDIQVGTAIIIFSCMIVILGLNVTYYAVQRKKEREKQKNDNIDR
ncbi:MAG: hypothetical protein WCY62_08465 [Clostridia bacterium]|jgi:hypothetical protein